MGLPDHHRNYTLDSLGPDLVTQAEKRQLDFTYERTDLLARMVVLLKTKSVLLVGTDNVGKKSLVRALAYRMMHMLRKGSEYREARDAQEAQAIEEFLAKLSEPLESNSSQPSTSPEKDVLDKSFFPFTSMFATTPFALDVNTPYAGDLGEKLHRIASEASAKKAIIFLENAHIAVGIGGASTARYADVANTLASCLTMYPFRMIASTTPRDLEILQQENPVFLTHFSVLEVGSVPRQELAPWFQRFENHLKRRVPVAFGPGFIDEILSVCDRFYPGLSYPGKAITLIRQIMTERLSMVQPCIHKGSQEAAPEQTLLLREDVQQHISRLSGLSLEMIKRDAVPKAMLETGLPEFFRGRIIGQPAAVKAAVELVAKYRARLCPPGKPVAVLWLAGTTGVGKTEFAKVVSEFFFGSRDRLVRYDMSEFKDPEAINRLLGNAGTQAAVSGSSLVQRIKAQPFSVILFDEVEKATTIMDLFLQLFDEAKLTGRDGSVAYFDNAIILLTSNLGSELFDAGLGFGASEATLPSEDDIRHDLEETYRPELINRIETIIPFRRLDRNDVEKILEREMLNLGNLPGLKGITRIYLAPEVKESILNDGYQPRFGVRPLKRAIDRYVIKPISFLLASEEARKSDTIVVKDVSGVVEYVRGKVGGEWIGFPIS